MGDSTVGDDEAEEAADEGAEPGETNDGVVVDVRARLWPCPWLLSKGYEA